MFTTIYLLLFIIFFSLGVFIGKKFTITFNPKIPIPVNEKVTIDLSSQYDTLIEMKPPLSFFGVTEDKIDIILLKDNSTLTTFEEQIKKLLQNNQVYLRVMVFRKD